MKWIKRLVTYFCGLVLIAVGINISKMAGLGISPVSSIPRALEVIFGLSLGTMIIVIYCVLVFCQFLVLLKKFPLKNLLGIPLGIVFGWLTDFVGINPTTVGHLMTYLPDSIRYPSNYFVKLLYLAVSIVVIGIGVYLYLKPSLISMPAEGLAAAISTRFNFTFGNCKTAVDVSMISIALILQFICLGGFSSFTGDNVVVREGTILAAIFVGQIVKLIRKWEAKKKK